MYPVTFFVFFVLLLNFLIFSFFFLKRALGGSPASSLLLTVEADSVSWEGRRVFFVFL